MKLTFVVPEIRVATYSQRTRTFGSKDYSLREIANGANSELPDSEKGNRGGRGVGYWVACWDLGVR